MHRFAAEATFADVLAYVLQEAHELQDLPISLTSGMPPRTYEPDVPLAVAELGNNMNLHATVD